MKKLILLCVLAALLLCSCGKNADYSDAAAEVSSLGECTITANDIMTVTTDGQDTVTEFAVKITLKDGVFAATETITTADGTTEARYYYKDGKVYLDGADGKYYWEDSQQGFLGMFCYSLPLELTLTDPEETPEGDRYTAELSGEDYQEKLLALNPAFAELASEELSFGPFTYTATVKGKLLSEYIFDYTFSMDEGDTLTTMKNVLTVTVQERAGKVDFPEDTDQFAQSAKDLEGAGLSEDEWNEQVLYVIFEALYNPDGSKSENYDAYYQQFAEQYGEEFMQRIAEVADMFRDPSVSE